MRPVVYARISKNHIFLRNISTRQEASVCPDSPFTTARMLVGEFSPFASALKRGLSQVTRKGFLVPPPTVIVHAVEMNEGGLCEIEKRILQEAAMAAGARKTVVYEGASLSDQQVMDLAR